MADLDETTEKDESQNEMEPVASTNLPTNGFVRYRGTSSRNQNSEYSMVVKEFEASVLSSLDRSSYELALGDDTKLVMENYLLPISIPWYKPKAPMIRTMPRDIDDMPGLWFADGVRMHQGSERGLMGFGAFDQGLHGYEQLRKGCSEKCILDAPETFVADIPHTDPCLPDDLLSALPVGHEYNQNTTFIVSARRSADPGVMEISAMLPPPRSLDSALLKYQTYGILSNDPWLRHEVHDIDRAKRIFEADRKMLASSMPLCMNAKRVTRPFMDFSFFENDQADNERNTPSVDEVGPVFFNEYERLGKKMASAMKKSKILLKRWLVSVKVENVSSRATLFPSSHHESGGFEGAAALTRPLICLASLPASVVQNGKHVQQAENKIASNGVNANSREQKMVEHDTTKKTCKNRTRLVWSNSSTAGGSGGGSKLPFPLTGLKIDNKCPNDLNAAVRLNGKLVSKSYNFIAGSNPEATAKTARAQKPSTNYSSVLAHDVKVSPKMTACSVELEEVIHRCTFANQNAHDFEYSATSFDKWQKLKSGQLKSNKVSSHITQEFVPMKHGGAHILKQVEPQISFITLLDYSTKIICDIPGRMQGSSVHTLLTLAARGLGNVCSICWTGVEFSQVAECCECGLLAHLECCLDRGKLTFCSDSNTVKIWQCAICVESLGVNERRDTEDTLVIIKKQPTCRKSFRLSKVPSRFTQNSVDGSTSVLDNQLYHKRLSKGRPSHKCTLCPHSGGAMSKLIGGNLSEDNDRTPRWTHEICRIWGQQKQGNVVISSSDSKTHISTPAGTRMLYSEIFKSYTSETCSLCGMGLIHNLGREKEEILSHRSSSFYQDRGISSADHMDLVPGLIRCGAKGCYVSFHPMCAVLSSKLRHDITHADGSKSSHKQDDKDLSKIYSLTLVNMMRKTERSNGSICSVVPIAFCGIHNPNREDQFYGKIV